MTAPTIVIGCGATKTPYPTSARHLYTGSLFTAARRAADADGRPWVIISALHGFLAPDEVVAPYNHTVSNRKDHDHLVQTIAATAHKVTQPLEAWCPVRYTEAMVAAGMHVTATPLADLPDTRMGYQIQWFTLHARANTPSLWSAT